MGFPPKSVTLPAYSVMVYWVLASSIVLGVMVRVLPFMVLVVGIIVPVLLWSWMFMFPSLMGSLKVVVITVFTGTLTAFLAGFPAVGVGAVLSVVNGRL